MVEFALCFFFSPFQSVFNWGWHFSIMNGIFLFKQVNIQCDDTYVYTNNYSLWGWHVIYVIQINALLKVRPQAQDFWNELTQLSLNLLNAQISRARVLKAGTVVNSMCLLPGGCSGGPGPFPFEVLSWNTSYIPTCLPSQLSQLAILLWHPEVTPSGEGAELHLS